MREDRFDDKIRELLNEAHEEYDQSSWHALNDRLDHEIFAESATEEEDFLPHIKEQLTNHRAEINEEHWQTLKSDLDYIQKRKERLYIVKTLEAAIVLLLFFTYYNYKWITNDVQMDVAYIEEIKDQSSSAELVEASISITSENRIDFKIPSQKRSTLTTISLLPTKGLIEGQSQSALRVKGNMGNDSIYLPLVDVKDRSLVQIAKLGINELTIDQRLISKPGYAILDEIPQQRKTKGWSVGLPISYDVNFVNTNLNLGYLSNQIQSGLGGSSMGVSVAYRFGNVELESGFRYGQKTFVPGLLTNYSKSSANSLLESQLDHMVIKQVQVPLLAKIYAAPERRSTLYGMVGIAANSILENDYAIRRKVVPNARFANTPTSDVVNLKALPKGLLGGGSFRETTYVTGIIGIGIQSFIIDDVSWYIQPQYQHSFTSDINKLVYQVNSLSVEGGFKFSF